MTIAAFVKHGEAVFSDGPIQKLLVATKRFNAKDLTPNLRTVGFHYNHSSSGINLGLARNPVLTKLESMDESVYRGLDGERPNEKLASAMAELAKARPTFKVWVRSGTEIASDAAVLPFFEEANPATLHTLALTNCIAVTDATAEAIAGSPKAAGLRKLHFFNSGIGPAGVDTLLSSAHLGGITDFGFTSYDGYGGEVWSDGAWNAVGQHFADLPEARAPKKLELHSSRAFAPALAEALKKKYGL